MEQVCIATTVALAIAAWAPPTWAGEYPADNTGKNVRDRAGDTLTSGDQSETSQDLAITQAVRKAIVADDSLSINAQNVKVITADGIVTLRGPVQSAEEKEKINAAVERVAGVRRVDNQLEVTTH
jgi:osmotically-inducible protein OsmY